MNTKSRMPTSICPSRQRMIASSSCCVFGCKHGLQKVNQPDYRYPAMKRPPPRRCYTGLCNDPNVRYCQDSNDRHSSNCTGYPLLRERIDADEVDCSEHCCACKPIPPRPKPKTCEEILGSVAKAQFAIAHILNGEADKLNKVTDFTDDFARLLEANQGVNHTLDVVAFLEQVLYDKLEQVQEICSSSKSVPRHTCDSHHP